MRRMNSHGTRGRFQLREVPFDDGKAGIFKARHNVL